MISDLAGSATSRRDSHQAWNSRRSPTGRTVSLLDTETGRHEVVADDRGWHAPQCSAAF